MSDLYTLRKLVSQPSATQTGVVTDVSPQGVITVLSGTRLLVCSASVPVSQGDKVRIQGQVILSKIDQVVRDLPVFRV